MKVGIVGLPNAGKTTIFNALCGGSAKVENYPFTTIDPNIGVVNVPDNRLRDIAGVYRPQRVVPTTINFLDVAGLVKGASQGEGLGNQFLSNIREVDAIVHVVRYFHDEEVPHSYGDVDPVRDVDIINTELMLADLEIVERNIKAREKARHSDKHTRQAYDNLVKIQKILEEGKLLKSVGLDPEEEQVTGEYGLLSSKPIVYVANIGEEAINKDIRPIPGSGAIKICGRWEAELIGLDEASQKEFMADAGLTELGLHKLARESYRLLGLITFFSTESSEVKAWTVKTGTKVPQAAGKIHTDMEKGFIKAEVIPYDVLMKWKDPHKAREHGELKVEGKEYILQDGDIIKVHFHA